MRADDVTASPAFSVTPMFPTFLFVHDHSNPASMNQRLVEFCYAARAADPNGRIVSSRGGWQSNVDMASRGELGPLIAFINDTVNRIKGYLSIDERFASRACG